MAESMYIHIPFCNRICTYCDFNKVLIDNQPVDAYVDALIKEIKQIEPMTLRTIFVGGGTPTALSEAQLERLLIEIGSRFTVTEEFSFEANPDELRSEERRVGKEGRRWWREEGGEGHRDSTRCRGQDEV